MAFKNVKRIGFRFLVDSFYFPFRTPLKLCILQLFKEEGIEIEKVVYVFCTDSYMLEINKSHLNHDTYTDIITFQYAAAPEPVLSEIYISVERVKENAKLFRTSFLQELYRVMFHGALHLCGYKDKAKKEVSLMRMKEEYYLQKFVPRGTL